MERRLYRSRTDRMIWGVCGGLAKYFNMDPTIIRFIAVLLLFVSGLFPAIVAYIILAIIIPLEGSSAVTTQETMRENVQEMRRSGEQLGRDIGAAFNEKTDAPAPPPPAPAESTVHRNRVWLGLIIVLAGILILVGTLNLFWWFRWEYILPAIIIVIGLLIFLAAWRR